MQQVAFLRTSKSETDFLKGAAERIYKMGGKNGYGIIIEKRNMKGKQRKEGIYRLNVQKKEKRHGDTRL